MDRRRTATTQRDRHPRSHHRRDVEHGRGQRIADQRRLGQRPGQPAKPGLHVLGHWSRRSTCLRWPSSRTDSPNWIELASRGATVKGLTWAYTDAWEKHVYAHLLPPNSAPIITYHLEHLPLLRGGRRMNPTSNHPGGVNVSFMDGSVHFIKNSISLQPWWYMGTRGRGEIISSDSY